MGVEDATATLRGIEDIDFRNALRAKEGGPLLQQVRRDLRDNFAKPLAALLLDSILSQLHVVVGPLAHLVSVLSERPASTMRATFENTRDSQVRSRLLQLPAELRFNILRLLLKKSDTIRSAEDCNDHQYFDDKHTPEWFQKHPEYDTVNNLSSQILRVCQQLYVDGKAILYQENTLSIYCSSTSWDLWECCVLDTWTFYNESPDVWPLDKDTLLSYAEIGCLCHLAIHGETDDVLCNAR